MKRLIALLSLFFLTACGPAVVMAAAPAGEMAIGTPTARWTATPNPSVTPTPTLNIQATSAWVQLEAARIEQDAADANARAAAMQATAEAERLATSVAMQAAQEAHDRAMATAQIEEQLAIQENLETRGTQAADARTATAIAPTLIVQIADAQAQAKHAEFILVTGAIWPVIFSTAILMLFFAVGLKIQAERESLAIYDRLHPSPAEGASPFVVQMTESDRSGNYLRADLKNISSAIVTQDELFEIAQGYRNGYPISRGEWVDKRRLLSRGRFNAFCQTLVDWGYAIRDKSKNNGITPTQLGGEYLYGLGDANG